MRNIIFTAVLMLLSGCALGAPGSTIETEEPITITQEATESLSLEMICQQKGYSWNASDSSCTYNQEGNPIIEIHYPIELVYYPFIEAAMDNYLNTYRTGFENQFAEGGINDIGPWQLTLGYTVYQHSATIISVQWNESFYTGGAHPGFNYTTFTFDTTTEQIVSFPELFVDGVDPLSSVMQPVRDRLNAQLGDMGDSIDMGTEQISDYSQFVLTDTMLVILFPPYQVAPYASGPLQVELALSEFGDLLKPQFR